MKTIEDLYDLLGTDNIEQALKNLEDERQGMRELHDENNALRIYNRRLRLIVNYALQVFNLCERDLALFVAAKMREMIGNSREQYGRRRRQFWRVGSWVRRRETMIPYLGLKP